MHDGRFLGTTVNEAVRCYSQTVYPSWSGLVQTHLCSDIVIRRGADDREADEEDVRLGIRQRPQSVVVLLSSGIPQPQANLLAVNLNGRRVVVEVGNGRVRVACMGEGEGCTYTVGMYSPGKAFVV